MKKYLIIAFSALVTTVLWTNCSGGLKGGAMEEASTESVSMDGPVTERKALLNFEQVFRSMLNLTDQTSPTSTQSQTFSSVAGALAEGSELDRITAPVLLAMSSLGGDVCNGVLAREMATGAQKRFFLPIDFNKGPDQVTEEKYQAVVSVLAKNFLSRDLTDAELVILKTYRTDFLAALTATERTSKTVTKTLMLATCTALISSFDALTY